MFQKSTRISIVAIIILLFLVSCSDKAVDSVLPSDTDGNSGIVAIPASTKSTTQPAPPDLDLTNLEFLSFIPGDLPEGFAVSKAVRSLPETYFQVANFSDMIYLPIEKNLLVQGGLYIFLFEDDSDRDNAYQLVSQEVAKRADILKVEMRDMSGIGEKATMLSVKGISIGIELNIVELVFEHCGAVVHLSLGDDASLEKVESMVTSYGGQLAYRLDTLACQK